MKPRKAVLPRGDITYLDWLLSAWGWTVSVSLSALLLALLVGAVVGTMRTLPNRPWVVRAGNAWVELFRNIPLLVQIFLWYHVLPSLFPALQAVPPSCWWCWRWGCSPRRAHCRAGAIRHPGLAARPAYAAMALGMGTAAVHRYVLLPMAFHIIIPPLTAGP